MFKRIVALLCVAVMILSFAGCKGENKFAGRFVAGAALSVNPVDSVIAKEVAAKYDFDVVAGVAVGGVPLATAVSLAAKKPCAIIRAQAKDHGKSQMVIGTVKDKRVLLIEDVTTSGGSSKYGVDELKKEGAIVESVVTVVGRSAF